MTSRFYRLGRPDLPWGDYGDILAHGMATPSENRDVLELERTGPFVPPLSQPWDVIVVTSDFLERLNASGLSGYAVRPVKKKKVTKIDWQRWDPYGKEEMKMPAGGEPENYIERRKHSEETSEALGELWWIQCQPGIQVDRQNGFRLVGDTWNGADFFVTMDEHPVHNYVSESARDWLTQQIPDWVTFQEERVIWK